MYFITFHHCSLETKGIDEWNRLNPFHLLTNVHGLLVQYLCVCVCVYKARVWACGISWEMSTKSLNWGCKLIKAVEQMVQTRSGHNETVSGETNRTWQDSCEGFVRWPAFRHLPGAKVYSSQESGNTTAWKLLSCFLGSNCISWCLLPPNVCLQNNLWWKWIMQHQQSVCIFFSPSHPQSFNLGRCFLVNTKSSTPVARAFSCLPTLTNPL